MKQQYLRPATQAQALRVTQVFMSSPTGIGKGEVGGTPDEPIYIN